MKYILLILATILIGCSNPIEIEPDSDVTGSWVGSYINNSFVRNGTSRYEVFEIEFLQLPDNTVKMEGIWKRWYGNDLDSRSYISGEGVFVAPYLSITGSSFSGVITLRGELQSGTLYLTKNGINDLTMERR